MNLASIIEKVGKLRALSQSDNVHEAATAAALAEKLIQEHRLSEAEIESAQAAPLEAPEESPDPLHVMKAWPAWRWSLASRLARLYGVSCYFDNVHKMVDLGGSEARIATGEKALKMIGRKGDVEIMRYQFAFLTVEIERLTQSFRRQAPIAYGVRTALNSFRMGAAVGVTDAMRDASKATVEAAPSGSAAMVLSSRGEESRALMGKLHPHLRSAGRSSARIEGESYEAGKAAGSSIGQRAAMGPGPGRSLKA